MEQENDNSNRQELNTPTQADNTDTVHQETFPQRGSLSPQPASGNDTVWTEGGASISAPITNRGGVNIFGGKVAINQNSMLPHPASPTRPKSYIPLPRHPLFQARSGEFEELGRLLFEADIAPKRLGLVGMVGVGKTQLAVELAYRYLDRFPAGVFWMPATGNSASDWQRQFADLADKTDYLPTNDDPSMPEENEARRARHFCRYLTEHKDALLILDNVEKPNLVTSALCTLSGGEIACAIIYTSRSRLAPLGVSVYSVEQLPEEASLRLLLETTRPSLLSEVQAESQDAEAKAARNICQGVGYLPLGLSHLRSLLARDRNMTLLRLADVLRQRGALELVKTQQEDATPLFTTFQLSWEKVREKRVQEVFKLASSFPEAVAIPLWLLGLAVGLGENSDIFEPLGEACIQLQEGCLLEALTSNQVRLHPLVREFGQRLLAKDANQGQMLLQKAVERLKSEFIDINKLEQRALDEGYWKCLKQVQEVINYVQLLVPDQTRLLERVKHWLVRSSSLLGNTGLWPKEVPGLFCQQLYNHAFEEGYTLPIDEIDAPWVRQLSRVGAEDHVQICEFRHNGKITSVAYAPNGSCAAIGCLGMAATDARCILWDVNTGQILRRLTGYYGSVTGVAFSPDGDKIVTSSSDEGASLLDVMSGQVLRRFPKALSAQEFLEEIRRRVEEIEQQASGHEIPQTAFKRPTNLEKVVFSPDGKRIAAASKDGAVYIWDIANGEMQEILTEHEGSLTNIAFSPDGRQVISTKNGSAFLWDAASKQVLVKLTGYIDYPAHAAFYPDYAAFLPDGMLLLVGQLLSSLGLTEANLCEEVLHSMPSELATDPLVAKNEIRVYALENGQMAECFEQQIIETPKHLFCAALSPDGKQIALCSSISPDNAVYIWNREQRAMRAVLSGHTDAITGVCFSPSGKHVLTCSEDGTTRIWDLSRSARTLETGVSRGFIEHIAFFPGGKRAVTASNDGIVQLWDVVNGEVLATMREHPSKSQVLALTCNPLAKEVMLTFADRSIALWYTPRDEVSMIPDFLKEKVKALCFSPDGNKIGAQLSSYEDGSFLIRMWDLLAEKSTTFQRPRWHSGNITCFAFSPDGSKIVACGRDGTVFTWDTETYSLLQYNEVNGMITNVCISPDNDKVAVGAEYGHISIWSMRSMRGRFLSRFKDRFAQLLGGLPGEITHMSFSPDGMLFLAAYEHGKICLWNVRHPGDKHLLGTYSTVNKIGAICWQEARRVVLADIGGTQGHPYFYHLALEGEW